jgi:carboxymethylenebutenolidase
MATPTTVTLDSSGAIVPTLVYKPSHQGPGPAIVVSPEAFGINEFTRRVASELCDAGYVVVVPDYYHGNGLENPESYTDFSEVFEFMEALDFGQGAHDIMAGIDYARSLPEVDPERVGVWGYCTGSTLAMLATSLYRRLAAAVWFFPSQPTFPELTPKRPVHALDLLWNVVCPVLLIIGDQDDLLVPVIPEFQRRFEQWGVDHDIRIYSGAGHAFSAPVPPLRNDGADRASWADAMAFVGRHLG